MADSDLGRRIRRAREAKRLHGREWTQQYLASLLGVSTRTVGRWEREGTVPRGSIGALEEVLGVPLEGPLPDPNEVEIRELAERLGLTVADADEWVRKYRRNQQGEAAPRERAS